MYSIRLKPIGFKGNESLRPNDRCDCQKSKNQKALLDVYVAAEFKNGWVCLRPAAVACTQLASWRFWQPVTALIIAASAHGQLWPLPETGDAGVDAHTILAQVVPLLKAGDILAHPFTRHPGGFVDRQGRVHGIVREALAMGLKVDVGHGSHFSYRMARIALDAGIIPHTLGADMHGYNTMVPAPPGTPDAHSDTEHMFFGRVRLSLASAMTAMLALGLPLDQVVRMVTCNVVDVFGLPRELGALAPGNPADVSVLHLEYGRWALNDNEGTQLIGQRLLRPAFCLRDGIRFEADASILPVVQAA